MKTPDEILQHYLKRAQTDVEVGHSDQLANAIEDAYDLGKAQARADYDAQLAAIDAINEQRLAYAMPAAVASMMEQAGMTELSLDMSEVATVFKRCKIDYSMGEVAGNTIINYKLTSIIDNPQEKLL